MKRNPIMACALIGLLLLGCSRNERATPRGFLEDYSGEWTRLRHAAMMAEWEAHTRMMSGDTSAIAASRAANLALLAFAGRSEHIRISRRLLEEPRGLSGLQMRQLAAVRHQAAALPEILADTARQRLAVERRQARIMAEFTYRRDGRTLTADRMAALLQSQTDPRERLRTWSAFWARGSALRPGLERLRHLRNETVRAAGFDDFFAYRAAQYDMTSAEVRDLALRVNTAIRPLYREIHTYMRYRLAAAYGEPVPDLIPAHWLSDPWGIDWSTALVPAPELDSVLAGRGSEWIIEQAEQFFVSLGFDPLPEHFYRNSVLSPQAAAALRPEQPPAAWHMDLAYDVRALMRVAATSHGYEAAHRELGRIYYFLSYSRQSLPPLLRRAPNRAFHEAIAGLMGLAALQPGFLAEAGLVSPAHQPAAMARLLRQALQAVVLLPWSAGVMTDFEYALYAGALPPAAWQISWRRLRMKHQGIGAQESADGADWDPAAEPELSLDPARGFDKAIAVLLTFQLHHHIAAVILQQDPRNANYYGKNKIGDFLKSILNLGATEDWQTVLKKATGKPLSAAAMLAYFEPLYHWLSKQNAGRQHTLPEQPEASINKESRL